MKKIMPILVFSGMCCSSDVATNKKIQRRSISTILLSIPWIESREGTPDNKQYLPTINQIESPKPSSNDNNEQTHFPSLNVDSQK